MIDKLLREIDKVAGNALKGCAQPISGTDVAYEAGRRIGVTNGIQLARQTIIDFYSKDNAQDNDL